MSIETLEIHAYEINSGRYRVAIIHNGSETRVELPAAGIEVAVINALGELNVQQLETNQHARRGD